MLVTDIRMPPSFQQEGIDAAKELRKRHPGTGVVVLSQYDDPDYAIALLGDGAAGYAYLLKDRVAEGDQLARAVREVATGGSVLDPKIVEALVQPVTDDAGLTAADEQLLHEVAEGRPIKAIAASQRHHRGRDRRRGRGAVPQAVGGCAAPAPPARSSGCACCTPAIVDREEQGETAEPPPARRAWPRRCATRGARIGETEELVVTVLMGDIRGYSGIAERSDPTQLAAQLSEHRAEMNKAILDEGGTVMQFVGDAVMAVFGAPVAARGSRRPRRVAAAVRCSSASAR